MSTQMVSPELEPVVALDQEIEKLGSGYHVAGGPLWRQEEGYLLSSEVRGNRRREWSHEERVTLLQEPTDNANELTRDLPSSLRRRRESGNNGLDFKL